MELAVDHPELCGRLVLLDSVSSQGYPLYRLDENYKPILTERIYKREDVENEPVQVVPVRKALEEGNAAMIKAGFDAVLYNLNPPESERYAYLVDQILKERCLNDVDTALACFNITCFITPCLRLSPSSASRSDRFSRAVLSSNLFSSGPESESWSWIRSQPVTTLSFRVL